jgi:hypothetical protein
MEMNAATRLEAKLGLTIVILVNVPVPIALGLMLSGFSGRPR